MCHLHCCTPSVKAFLSESEIWRVNLFAEGKISQIFVRGIQGRIQGGGVVTPPALDHPIFFSTNFLTIAKKTNKKNRSEYSMDAMYLNLMCINPRAPVGAGAEGARCTRPSLTPLPAKNPGSAPGI